MKALALVAMPSGSAKALRVLRAVNRAPTREEWTAKRTELEMLDRERKRAAGIGSFRDRIRRAMATEALEIIDRYRVRGLRAKELREAVERHAKIIETNEPEMAELLRETPLIAQAPNRENQRRAAEAKARRR